MLFPKKKYTVTLILISIIILAHTTGILIPLERVLTNIIKPLLSGAYTVSRTISKNSTQKLDSYSLAEENKELRKENLKLQQEITELEVFRSENKQLKILLEYTDTTPFKRIIARVIGQREEGGNTLFTINRGAKQGIAPNDIVLTEHGTLLGKVFITSDDLSYIRLITHPQVRFAVKQASGISAIGIAQGDFSVSMRIDMIPLDLTLDIGERIVTAALQETPDNILVGTVTQVERDSNGLFQHAFVKPLFRLDEVLFVRILTQKDNDPI